MKMAIMKILIVMKSNNDECVKYKWLIVIM